MYKLLHALAIPSDRQPPRLDQVHLVKNQTVGDPPFIMSEDQRIEIT